MPDIFQTVEALDLPDGEFAVISSGILGALGLREVNDVDLVVTPEVLEQFKEKDGWHSYAKRVKHF